jgi:hypothetical protein
VSRRHKTGLGYHSLHPQTEDEKAELLRRRDTAEAQGWEFTSRGAFGLAAVRGGHRAYGSWKEVLNTVETIEARRLYSQHLKEQHPK